MKNSNDYTIHPVKPSEVPTRGKWKAIALDVIEKFDMTPKRHIEVKNKGKPIKSRKELMALYDAFKAVIKKNKLNLEVRTEKGKLFLSKDLRYFVK